MAHFFLKKRMTKLINLPSTNQVTLSSQSFAWLSPDTYLFERDCNNNVFKRCDKFETFLGISLKQCDELKILQYLAVNNSEHIAKSIKIGQSRRKNLQNNYSETFQIAEVCNFFAKTAKFCQIWSHYMMLGYDDQWVTLQALSCNLQLWSTFGRSFAAENDSLKWRW